MENLDIDKFLDNDYDTIAKPDYSSLSWQGYGGGSPQRRSETWRATEYSEGTPFGGWGR